MSAYSSGAKKPSNITRNMPYDKWLKMKRDIQAGLLEIPDIRDETPAFLRIHLENMKKQKGHDGYDSANGSVSGPASAPDKVSKDAEKPESELSRLYKFTSEAATSTKAGPDDDESPNPVYEFLKREREKGQPPKPREKPAGAKTNRASAPYLTGRNPYRKLIIPAAALSAIIGFGLLYQEFFEKPNRTAQSTTVQQTRDAQQKQIVQTSQPKKEETRVRLQDEIEQILMKPLYTQMSREHDIENLIKVNNETDVLNALRKIKWCSPQNGQPVTFEALISGCSGSTQIEKFSSLFSSGIDIRTYLFEAVDYFLKTGIFPGDIPMDEYEGYIAYLSNGVQAFDMGNYLAAIDNLNKFIIAAFEDGLKDVYHGDQRINGVIGYQAHTNAVYRSGIADEIITVRSAMNARSLQEYLNKLRQEPRIFEREWRRAVKRASILTALYAKNPWLKSEAKAKGLSDFFTNNIGEEVTREVLNRILLDRNGDVVSFSSLMRELNTDNSFSPYLITETLSRVFDNYDPVFMKSNTIVNLPLFTPSSSSDFAGYFVYSVFRRLGEEYSTYQRKARAVSNWTYGDGEKANPLDPRIVYFENPITKELVPLVMDEHPVSPQAQKEWREHELSQDAYRQSRERLARDIANTERVLKNYGEDVRNYATQFSRGMEQFSNSIRKWWDRSSIIK